MSQNESSTIHGILLKALQRCDYNFVALSIEIGASDKSIYKWYNRQSVPDGRHLLRLISFAGMDLVEKAG